MIFMEDLPNCLTPLSSSSSSSEPDPFSTVSDIWLMAEQRTHEVLCTVRPNLVSETHRNEIIDYIQRVFRFCGTEVFPFGSVPLKTYLPDGDIDLTALCHPNAEEDLASNICHILRAEEHNTEYQVKDVHFIHAQVKVVKCRIQNIPVDISFNQTAGLCALSFLEQVDQLIGNDHLFKRSIILIKSWCYYESRILGAHHGLISTYALEILVLHVFNLFHSSLSGPLGVLHKFLDYYSIFDWEHYCVTINGPVAISSLSGNMEIPESDGNGLLFSKHLIEHWRHILSVPTTWGHVFHIKHLNILDPLNDNNNLGRSVSRGNFHRVRCALSYGAVQLSEIVRLPGESLGDGVEKFFMNTLGRNGRGQRPDVMFPIPAFGIGRALVSNLNGDYDSYYNVMLYGQWYRNYTSEQAIPPSPWNRNPLTFMEWIRWNFPTQWSTDSFVPRPQINSPRRAGVNLAQVRRSRGTGTYIPRRAQNDEALPLQSCGGVPPRFRLRSLESGTQLLAAPCDVYSETDPKHENGSSLADISLEALSLQSVRLSPPPSPSPDLLGANASSSTHGLLTVFVTTQKQEDPKGSHASNVTDK